MSMRVSPMVFDGPMVRALREAGKTQARRVLKQQPDPRCTEAFCGADGVWRFSRPTARAPISSAADDQRVRYAVGDLLWVRETWAVSGIYDGAIAAEINPKGIPNWCGVRYAATDACLGIKKRPAIHMPRWASRTTLEVTSVKVERLQDISDADAIAEGIEYAVRPFGDWALIDCPYPIKLDANAQPPVAIKFAHLWNTINEDAGKRWADNPWVVAVTFKVHRVNVDVLIEQRKAA